MPGDDVLIRIGSDTGDLKNDLAGIGASLGSLSKAAQSSFSTASAAVKNLEGNIRSNITTVQSEIEAYKAGAKNIGEYVRQKERSSQVAAIGNQELSALNQQLSSLEAIRNKLREGQAEATRLSAAFATVRASLAGIASAAGVTFGAKALFDFTKGVFTATAAVETLKATFTAITGSSQRAGQELSFLKDLANKLGFEYVELSKSYVSLIANSEGTALAGEKTHKVFTQLVTAARGLGLDSERLKLALLALGQMMSKGTVQSEEMRGQLAEALPGSMKIAAAAMGVTTGEFMRMMEQGLVPITEFIPKFGDQMEKTFGNVAASTQTGVASLERLKTAWGDLNRAIGDLGVYTAFTAAITNVTAVINGLSLAMHNTRSAAGVVASAVGGYLTNVGVLAAKSQEAVAAAQGQILKIEDEAANARRQKAEERIQEEQTFQDKISAISLEATKAELLNRAEDPAAIARKQNAELHIEQEKGLKEQLAAFEKGDAQGDRALANKKKLQEQLAEVQGKIFQEQGGLNQPQQAAVLPPTPKFLAAPVEGYSRATDAAAKSSKNLADNVDKAVSSLTQEREALKLSDRAYFVFQRTHEEVAKLEKSSLPDSQARIDKLKELAGALFDQTRAHNQAKASTTRASSAARSEAKQEETQLEREQKARETAIETLNIEMAALKNHTSVQQERQLALKGLTEEQRQQIITENEHIRTQEAANAAEKERLSTIDSLTQTYSDQLASINAQIEAYQRGIPNVKQYADEQLRLKKIAALNDPTLDNLVKEIELRSKVLDPLQKQDKEIKAANKNLQEEAKRTAEVIEQSLTDALMRGFESGKGFAENFKDTIINLLKTLILKPIIESIAKPLAQAIVGGIPTAGQIGGAGGIAGLLGGLGGVGGGGGAAPALGFSPAIDFSPRGQSQLGSTFGGALGFLKSPLVSLGRGFESIKTSIMSLFPTGSGAIGGIAGSAVAGAGFGGIGGMLGNLLGFKGTGANVGGLLGGAGGGMIASLTPALAAIPGIGPILAGVGGLLGTILGGSLFKKPVPRAAMFGHFQGDQFQTQDWAKGGGATSTIKPIFDQTIGLLRTLSKEIGFSVDQLRASVQFEGKTGKFAGEVLGKGPRFETGKFSLEDEASIKGGLSELITRVLSQVELPKRFKSVTKETTVEGVATRVQSIKDFEKALIDLKGATAPLLKDWNDMLQQLGDMHAKAVDFGFGLGAVTKATDKAITSWKENFMKQFTGADEIPKTWKETKQDFKDFIKSMREIGEQADFSQRHLDILTKEAWENFNKKMEESRKSIMASIEDMSGEPKNQMVEFKAKMLELRNAGMAAGLSVDVLDAAIRKSTVSFKGQLKAEQMREAAERERRIPETKAQLIELTGREAPVGLQFRLFKSQLKQIQASFVELGMSLDDFRRLKMEAISHFFRDLKEKIKEQIYELAGKPLPVQLQFHNLKRQLKDIQSTWSELGLNMDKFRELKTDSIKHFFRNLRTQAIQGIYELAGKPLPVAAQLGILRRQLKDLKELWKELGMDMGLFRSLKTDAIKSFFRNLRTQAITGMYELAGKPLPVAVQFGILKRQMRDLRDLWKELGMSMALFGSLKADAIKSFFRNLRTQAVQGIYELVGKPIPVAAQLAILKRQIKDLKELWQQLGMSMGLFNTLKAEAISNFFFNLKKQTMEGMHELAGRPLPVSFQFKILKKQIKDLQEIWGQLGLSMSLFKELKAEAIENFFFNLKKQVMEGMAELAGRPLPVGIQLQFLNKQIKNLQRQWRELGLSLSLFNELRADAITNFFFNLQKQAIEGMAELSDTPIPVSFQLKGLNKQIKDLQRLWQELGLNMRQFGELKTEAIRNFFLNLRKQAIGGMHELAGRPLPVGLQFEVLNKQINNLQRIWQGLGLSMAQFKELKGESVKGFFFNLRKQVVDGLYELAGRPVYVPLAFEALKQQLRVFQKSWLELGGNLQHFRALKADAIRNFYDNLRKQALEGIYQLAGRPLPLAYLVEGLDKQFRDLQKVWEDIGLSLNQFKQLKAEAVVNFFDNLRDQVMEGLYGLAGRPMPIAIQFAALRKQIRNLQHTWLELGLSLAQFKELKADALAKFWADAKKKTLEGMHELAGRPMPVPIQLEALRDQIRNLQHTWIELGLDINQFKELKAEALTTFIDNLKKQVMTSIYELAGKPLPVSFQLKTLQDQFKNLQRTWTELGLDLAQFKALKTDAITKFFADLKQKTLQGLYELAGRPLPVAFQLGMLNKQIMDLQVTWNELGLSLDLFKQLSTQAVTNFFDKLKNEVLGELYSLAGEPLPLNIQMATLKKHLQELKIQFTELNLPLSLFEKLSKKAMDKLVEDYNKARAELERAKGGFIGFLSKTGEILSEAPAVERTLPKEPEKGFATGALNQIFNRPSTIQVAERGPEQVSVRPVGSDRGAGGITINFQGPNVMDAIGAGIFARTIERQLSKRRARFA